ncbi:MAG: hypothetical protein Q9227_009161 [Pyrenula ochraceoflavens]
MDTGEKNWAKEYLLDPLNAPEPADETGPGTHFVAPPSSTSASANIPTPSPSVLSSKNPYRRLSKSHKSPFANTSEVSTDHDSRAAATYPSPPPSASPRQSKFPGRYRSGSLRDDKTTSTITKDTERDQSDSIRRSMSLKARYPNDPSIRPLDQIKQSHKKAYRTPNLKKSHHIHADSIDQLDNIGGAAYHHEGPFDATYASRNRSFFSSPLEAVAGSTEETLKATPRERVMDSVRGHRPLDGVAAIPNGYTDREGRVFRYQEGENMMIDINPEGGPYKRWPGVKYTPEDIKGKGEPSYSVEKALKDHKDYEYKRYKGGEEIEMLPRPYSAGSDSRHPAGYQEHDSMPAESGVGRSNTVDSKRRSGSGTLKKRFGDIRRKVGGGDN